MSSSIKIKSRKTFQGNVESTLDKSHVQKINEFAETRDALPKKKLQLKRLEKKLNDLNNRDTSEFTNDDINSRATLLDSIELLKNEIHNVENNVYETDYYWKTADQLTKYYELTDTQPNSSTDNSKKKTRSSKKKDDNSALIKLNKMRQSKLPKKPSTRKIKIKNSPSGNILGFFPTKKNTIEQTGTHIDRAKINDEYQQLTDPRYRSKYKKINNIKTHCGKEMLLRTSDGNYVCSTCGITKMAIVDSDKPSHKEHAPEPTGYPYKRINHFNEHLAQIQAKETTDIPQYVYTDIKEEMKRRRENPEQLNYNLLRNILKKLGFSRYYEHIPYMIFKINGRSPPVMTRDMENELKRLFKMTLKPFEKYKPPRRVNYLKYSYALYKLCQLLEYDDFLLCCSLFKSKEKLRQQDALWKKICDDLNWEFYPSEL
jgi:hypothetical protein